jgi:NADPH-dependent ferric siderophore reductase
MLRVVLGGEELRGFVSEGHDDHAKIFFPDESQEKPIQPTPGPNGPVFPQGVPRGGA